MVENEINMYLGYTCVKDHWEIELKKSTPSKNH